ncbi:MAG: biopolymer transporter ExbD [Alphaproteobacteria bacterium]|nr:biopolymer transporter ExbD [Alphaproteobacteria bacterium]
MTIGSPLPHKKARIEIIPLIDIMFFLLASFMMVSVTMIRLQSIKMDLPTATQAKRDFKPLIINLQVDKQGEVWIEKEKKTYAEVSAYLSNRLALETNLPVYISGDKDATHGSVIAVLDLVRRVGIQKVSFAISFPETKKK